MILGWSDRFHYGVHTGDRVKDVWIKHPSYLVWTVLYTAHRFDQTVMNKLEEFVAKGPGRGITQRMFNKWQEDFSGGPW